jgi:hypothetical protein
MKVRKWLISLSLVIIMISSLHCSGKQIIVHLVCVPVPTEAYYICVNTLISDSEEVENE